MADNVEAYLTRPKRYENIDGTSEMFFGFMYLGFALLAYLQSILPKDSVWNRGFAMSLLFMYVVLLPTWLLGFWAGKVIKRRITWPRTGYVAYRRPAKKGLAVFFTAMVVAAAVTFVLVRLMKGQDLTSLARPGMLASLVAPYLLFLVLGKEPAWKWAVALFMALGCTAIGLLVPGSAVELFRPASWFAGLTWIGSGCITLYLYIRRTRPCPDRSGTCPTSAEAE